MQYVAQETTEVSLARTYPWFADWYDEGIKSNCAAGFGTTVGAILDALQYAYATDDLTLVDDYLTTRAWIWAWFKRAYNWQETGREPPAYAPFRLQSDIFRRWLSRRYGLPEPGQWPFPYPPFDPEREQHIGRILFEPSGRLLYATPGVADYLGYPRDELIDRDIRTMLMWSDRQKVDALLSIGGAAAIVRPWRIRILNGQGLYRPLTVLLAGQCDPPPGEPPLHMAALLLS